MAQGAVRLIPRACEIAAVSSSASTPRPITAASASVTGPLALRTSRTRSSSNCVRTSCRRASASWLMPAEDTKKTVAAERCSPSQATSAVTAGPMSLPGVGVSASVSTCSRSAAANTRIPSTSTWSLEEKW